jgi:hypothetical protein
MSASSGTGHTAFAEGQCLEYVEMLFLFTKQCPPILLFPFVRVSYAAYTSTSVEFLPIMYIGCVVSLMEYVRGSASESFSPDNQQHTTLHKPLDGVHPLLHVVS